MKKSEARKILGIKETDRINRDGVRSVMKSVEERLKGWMLPSEREKLEKDIEALKALLG